MYQKKELPTANLNAKQSLTLWEILEEEVRWLLCCKQRAATRKSLVAQLMPSPLPLSSQLCSRHFSGRQQKLETRPCAPGSHGVVVWQGYASKGCQQGCSNTSKADWVFWFVFLGGRILRFEGGVLVFFLYFCCYCLFHLPANAHACMFRQGLAIPTHCSGLLEWLLPSAWMTSSTTLWAWAFGELIPAGSDQPVTSFVSFIKDFATVFREYSSALKEKHLYKQTQSLWAIIMYSCFSRMVK